MFVTGAVRRNKLLNKPSNSEIENEVKVWLRQSCDSSGGRQKRNLAKSARGMKLGSRKYQPQENRRSQSSDDVESDN